MRHDRPAVTWRAAIATDARAASTSRLAALITLIVALLYEWGSGNETLNVTVIASAYERHLGVVGIAMATLVGGVAPALLQVVTGSIAALGFAAVTATTDKSWSSLLRLRPDLAGSSWLGLRPLGQFAVAFGLGASVAVLIEQMTTGRSGLRAMLPVIARSAAYTGLGAAGVSLALTSATESARRFERTRPAADFLLRWATNPVVWFVLFTLLAVWAWWSGRSSANVGS
ncbi:MAG: hypothetical protein R2710_18670 [Acidimicrobiales bacterium]